MSRAFVLRWEAANTNASGYTERHGPETEHVQFAASTRAGLWALAYNRKQEQEGQGMRAVTWGRVMVHFKFVFHRIDLP